MIQVLGVLLLVNAIFNVLTWPRFLQRVYQDARAYDDHGHPTRFLRVHQVLVTMALIIALASAVGGLWALCVPS